MNALSSLDWLLVLEVDGAEVIRRADVVSVLSAGADAVGCTADARHSRVRMPAMIR